MGSWVVELRQAFSQLQAGGQPRVNFADRTDPVGEVGREFNALAADWEQTGAKGWTREQCHRLRNRLAGILAALHLLGEEAGWTPEERTELSQLVKEARELDARLRSG